MMSEILAEVDGAFALIRAQLTSKSIGTGRAERESQQRQHWLSGRAAALPALRLVANESGALN